MGDTQLFLTAADGLGTSAARIQFFGEMYVDPNIPGMTVSDMGSGLSPRNDDLGEKRGVYAVSSGSRQGGGW